MPSGAGHDAMIMAGRMPTAMLFLRSPGGLSHHPDEASSRRGCGSSTARRREIPATALRRDSLESENAMQARSPLHHLGATRSSLKHDHLLQTPDTFVRIPLPGATGVEFIVHAGPQLGANFTQMTAEFSGRGTLGTRAATAIYLRARGRTAFSDRSVNRHLLGPGGFAYLPTGADHSITAMGAARAALIEKIYEPVANVVQPRDRHRQ